MTSDEKLLLIKRVLIAASMYVFMSEIQLVRMLTGEHDILQNILYLLKMGGMHL